MEYDGIQKYQGRYRLHTVLTLYDSLTDEQHTDLLHVAGKCPVHRLMTKTEVSVDTKLVEHA